jgi:hypothetical protein
MKPVDPGILKSEEGDVNPECHSMTIEIEESRSNDAGKAFSKRPGPNIHACHLAEPLAGTAFSGCNRRQQAK